MYLEKGHQGLETPRVSGERVSSGIGLGRKLALVRFLLWQSSQIVQVISANHATFPLYPRQHCEIALHGSTHYEKEWGPQSDSPPHPYPTLSLSSPWSK